MSLTFGGIYTRKDFSADWSALLGKLGLKKTVSGETVSWSDSVRRDFEDTALGVWNGCTMLNNQYLIYDASFEEGKTFELDQLCAGLSEEGDVFCFLVDGTTSTGAFTWYHAGRRIRVYNNTSGKITANFGPLLPSEQGQPVDGEDPEDRVMAVMGFMTGASLQELLDNDLTMTVCR